MSVTPLYFTRIIFVFSALSISRFRMTVEASSFKLKFFDTGLVSNSYADSNLTLLQKIRKVDYSSYARYKYLTGVNILPLDHDDDIEDNLVAMPWGFLVTFLVGDPLIQVNAVIDTGSSIFWIPCKPCTNCPEPPKYNPANSYTYESLSCSSKRCNPSKFRCNDYKHCAYRIRYGDGSETEGVLAKERFRFTTSDEGVKELPHILFGCGHKNHGLNMEIGTLGLGAGSLSLINQIGSNFSYCIGRIYDPTYQYHHIAIGENAKLRGSSTPFQIYNNHYYLTLEAIFVRDKNLNIDPNLFKKKRLDDNRGVLIDSGSKISYLVKSAHTKLVEEVHKYARAWGAPKRVHVPNKLCYHGTFDKANEIFPWIAFQFAGGVKLDIGTEFMFLQYPGNHYCLAIDAVEDDRPSIIGILAQQNHNWGYNLLTKTLYVEGIDCQLLAE